MAHAVLAFAVDARLVGSDHSRFKRYAVEVLAYVLWPFVHAQEETDSVAGSVAEIALAAP